MISSDFDVNARRVQLRITVVSNDCQLALPPTTLGVPDEWQVARLRESGHSGKPLPFKMLIEGKGGVDS